MKLTIQIVNFKSRHYLEECLFSIAKDLTADTKAEIIIINNDEAPLAGAEPPTAVMEIGRNIGFGKAHNAGCRRARGDYILFLNPDTKILSKALRGMLDVLAGDERVGVVAPLLVDSRGNIQPDCFGSERTPLSAIKGKFSSQKKYRMKSGREIFEPDWVSGGAMMVRRDVFEKIGGFDENYFMYFEDVDLCLRTRKLGYKVVINQAARIFHESGKSFESEGEKKKYYYASQDYYMKKHFGPVGAMLVRLLRVPYYVKNVYLSSK